MGREAVLAATRKLLHDLPPARVTTSAIAREAGIDPALVRYYFGDRTNLLLAVVDEMIGDAPMVNADEADPVAVLAKSIQNTARFTRSTRHIHRLMVDELADAKSAEVRERLGQMNAFAIQDFAKLMERDDGRELRKVDPLFLHIALIGLFDFFVSAQPVIRALVPEGTDMDALAAKFEAFVTDLVLEGVKAR